MAKKIFIIDDDQDIVEAFTIILESHGYEVKSTYTASNAINAARDARPDLIILDVMFPEDQSKGFELSRELKQDNVLKDVPIVILSAINEKFKLGFSRKDIDESWMPVEDFIEKPVEPSKLVETIERILGKQ